MILGFFFLAMTVGVTVAYVRITRHLRRLTPGPPPITQADVECFELEMALCGDDVDIAAAAKERR